MQLVQQMKGAKLVSVKETAEGSLGSPDERCEVIAPTTETAEGADGSVVERCRVIVLVTETAEGDFC